MPIQTLRLELAFDQHLGGDPGMIRTHLPQGLITLHPPDANQRIHQRVLKRVTHVQAAGHVRGWNHDAEGIAVARGREVARSFPLAVQFRFDRVGVEVSFHLGLFAPCAAPCD